MLEDFIVRSVPLCRTAQCCAVALFIATAYVSRGYAPELWLTVAMYACALAAEIFARAAKEAEE